MSERGLGGEWVHMKDLAKTEIVTYLAEVLHFREDFRDGSTLKE